MAFLLSKSGFGVLLVLSFMTVYANSHTRPYKPPGVKRLTDLFSHVSINQSFSTVYGGPNIKLLNNGSFVNLALDKSSGAGLVSKDKYHYGFFSAAIRLPAGPTSGVVVAFYLSNAETYPHNHDEIDIELLGHDQRNDWVFQTNVYANGSTGTGREEKFYLWFDPTSQYHLYSIIWNSHHTVFLVDNVPVREFVHNTAYPSVYPSKPMSLYATIWDASEWATHGGKYPVNYKYAPFVASLGEMELSGCVPSIPTSSSSSSSSSSSPCAKTTTSSVSSLNPVEGQDFVALSKDQSSAMDWARRKLMFYSYCSDVHRYKVMPPECK